MNINISTKLHKDAKEWEHKVSIKFSNVLYIEWQRSKGCCSKMWNDQFLDES
jgi:hypothetical protein